MYSNWLPDIPFIICSENDAWCIKLSFEISSVFVKGQATGKLTDCEDNFARPF